ncbi:MAG: DUF3857 domain-containing protein [Bacteroidales bacterium]|nr:DUF3857 domain-containing protein [Bacteroidales bacterium]
MIKKTFLIVSFLFAGLLLSADQIPDLIKNSGTTKDYPTSNLLTIFDSTKVDVQESGLSYIYTHQLYKILTPRGALSKSVIKYGYDPLSAYAEIIKVKIYRDNGETEELDVNNILDYPAPARGIYWGAREKMIEVGRLEPGDAIEVFLFKKGFTYALLHDGNEDDERYIPPMRGHFYDIVPFWSSEPILTKVYQVKIPKDKLVQYEFYNGEVESSAVLIDDKMVYTFSKKDIMPFKREPGMVAYSDVAPKLLMSTSPDWKAKSLWFYGVNEDFGSFESTPEIDKKVAEILIGAEDEMDSISRLTHWAADEIRYSGISMGEGEGYTLHTGDMNFTDRCGVCKDKAGMLITLLRAAGFESYPAMTMAGSRIDYIPADQFNHCVTIVKLSNGEYKLLDPTWVPLLRELWSSAEQQQNYLMGVPEGADLKITPLSAPENHYFKISGKSELLPDGTLKGNLSITAEGQSDAGIRRMFTGYYKSEWKNSIEKEILKISPLAEIEEIEFGKPYDYMANPILIKIKYKIPEYALVSDEEIIFTPIVAANLFKRGMSHLYFNTNLEERKYNFRDRCSRLVELNETILVPENAEAVSYPSSESIENEITSFEGSIEQEGRTIILSEKIRLGKRIYEPEDWEMYRKVVVAQNKFAEQPIILRIDN